MPRLSLPLLLLALCIAAMAATATKVVLNGKVVSVPVVVSNGKAFVDAAALAKQLGGSATYDAANHKLTLNLPASAAQTAAGSGGRTGTAKTGTAPFPGGDARYGDVVSLRKGSPLYFSLKSAEFTTSLVAIGDQWFVPTASEKLLVLHFTIQNPQKTDLFVRFDSLRFTAVDAMNVNHEAERGWGDEESKDYVGLSLKPAQTLKVYAVIRVPAKGPVPKLMVQPGADNDGPIARYDLVEASKVTGLKPPIADPADPTGATALKTVPAALSAAYPMSRYELTVESLAYSKEAMDGAAPPKGAQYLMVTLLLDNKTTSPALLRHDCLKPRLVSSDGESLVYKGMVLATADRRVAQDLPAGQSMRVRLYFAVPDGSKPKTLVLQERDSRAYEWEIAQ